MLKRIKIAEFSGEINDIIEELRQEPMAQPPLLYFLKEADAIRNRYCSVGTRRLEFGAPQVNGTLEQSWTNLTCRWTIYNAHEKSLTVAYYHAVLTEMTANKKIAKYSISEGSDNCGITIMYNEK